MKKQNILVIGGAGYIGSHLTRVLSRENFNPVIFDNLSTGHREFVPRQVKLIKGDLCDYRQTEKVFSTHKIDAVVHLSAFSLVGESTSDPLKYYANNVLSFINLLRVMRAHKVKKIIFSSTGAVYGQPRRVPIPEETPRDPINPYGQSKSMMEKIMEDTALAYGDIRYIIFRYFNVAGAIEDGSIGERHDPETHLIPNVLKSLTGRAGTLNIFGNDFDTKDGTCIRDYIHVMDLSYAHVLGLRALDKNVANQVFNLGTQHGASVMEIVKVAEKVTGRKIPYKIAPRRPGDPAKLIADASKAAKILKWVPARNLEEIIRSAWAWETSPS